MAVIRVLLVLCAVWFGLGAMLSLLGLLVSPWNALKLVTVFSVLTVGCWRLARVR